MTLQDRMNDNTGIKGYDPATPKERQAWIDGKMTDEEFIELCEKKSKEHYSSTK